MPDLTAKKQRPVWYNLSPVNLPLPGLVSIFHRVSGLLLFLALIWMIYLLDLSLRSEADFNHLQEYLGFPIVKLGLLVLLWSFLHHFCAGIRFLFLDLHKGIDLPTARATSYVVFVASILLTVVLGAKIW